MTGKIVDIKGAPRSGQSPPVSDFWFAQIDVRLGKIEFMVARLEWQIWMLVCSAFGVLIYQIVKALAAN